MTEPKEVYISVDVETSGQSALDHSLLSIGACVVGARHKTFYVEMQPGSWEKEPDAKAMEVNGLDWKKLKHSGEPIVVGMLEFRKWISRVAGGRNQKAVFTSFGTFDWNWVNHYMALTGEPNDFFGPNTLDLKCVSPSTKILTADLRWVPASDISEGQELVGFDEYTLGGKARRLRRATVFQQGRIRLPSVEVELASGKKLVCAEDHHWLTRRARPTFHGTQWKPAKNLLLHKDGSQLKRPIHLIRVFKPWEVATDWEAGYVAGMYDGEGCLGATNRQIGIIQGEANDHLLEGLLGILQKHSFFITGTDPRMTSSGKTSRGFTIHGGISEQMRFVGTFRPRRLLKQLAWEDGAWARYNKVFTRPMLSISEDPPYLNDEVLAVTSLGDRDLIVIATSTGTYFADGYAAHNSYYMGWRGTTWIGTRKKNMPKEHLAGRKHTHNALDDAVEQAIMFEKWLKERNAEQAEADLREAVGLLERGWRAGRHNLTMENHATHTAISNFLAKHADKQEATS